MSTAETTPDQPPVAGKLRALGVDVTQLGDEPLPDELWQIIANVIQGIWIQKTRWYVAAAMYGRFLDVLRSGGTTSEIVEQFGDGRALRPLLKRAELRELVLAARLPGRLNTWLADTVRQTRLTRREKLTVVTELIDQIQIGLSSGQTSTEIAAQLGTPRSAARRLRREKLSQRNWLWRAFRRTWQTIASIALVLLAAVIGLLFRYYMVHPAEFGDEVDRLDARAAAVPAVDRAWPLYAAGLEKFSLPPRKTLEEIQRFPAILAACEEGPRHPEWPAAVDYIDANKPVVELFLEASAKPRLGYIRRDPLNDGWLRNLNHGTVSQTFARGQRWEVSLPEIPAFRNAMQLLMGSAHQAASAGDTKRALDCLAALVTMTRHAWEGEEYTVSRLAALSYFDAAAQTLETLLTAHADSWSDDELQHSLDILSPWNRDWQRELLAGFREWNRFFLAEMFSEGGRFTREGFETVCAMPVNEPQLAWLTDLVQTVPPGHPLVWSGRMALVGACLVPFVGSREELLKEFDELNDLYESGLQIDPTGATASVDYDAKLAGWLESKRKQVKYLPLLINWRPMLLMGRFASRWRKITERDGVRIAVACYLFRRRHAAWPESTNELVPEFLTAAPIDPIDGKPLRVVIIGNRPYVYSVSFDHIDSTAGIPAEKLKEVDSRDWQLFPRLDPKTGAEPAP